MEYAEIFKKIQENHNYVGEVYLQLAKTVDKLNKLHMEQVKTIEELEFEVISQKIRIEILLKGQNEGEESGIMDKDLNLRLNNEERNELNINDCGGIRDLELDQTQPTPKFLMRNENTIFVSDKKDCGTISKEKSNIKVNSKFLKKKQPKIEDFWLIKPQNEEVKQDAKSEKNIKVQTRIIVDENGFRSLSHKKTKN